MKYSFRHKQQKMKYLLIVLAFVFVPKANAYILQTPLNIQLSENLTIPNVGPQRIFVKGIASNPGFDIDIFDIRSTTWGEANVVFSLNIRTATQQLTSSSYVRSEDVCFEPDCVLGWDFVTLDNFPVTAGVPFELSIFTDSNFYQIFLDGTFITNYRHRIALKHAAFLTIRNDISIFDLQINQLQLS